MDIREQVYQNNGYRSLESNNNESDSPYLYCEDNFFNKVILPEISYLNEPSIFNRILDKATGINSWIERVASDSCKGEQSLESGKLLAKAVVKTGANTVVALGTAVVATVGVAAASPIIIGGSLAAGAGVMFGVVPWVSDKIVDNSVDFIHRSASRIKEYY